jgi:hypothetical protein
MIGIGCLVFRFGVFFRRRVCAVGGGVRRRRCLFLFPRARLTHAHFVSSHTDAPPLDPACTSSNSLARAATPTTPPARHKERRGGTHPNKPPPRPIPRRARAFSQPPSSSSAGSSTGTMRGGGAQQLARGLFGIAARGERRDRARVWARGREERTTPFVDRPALSARLHTSLDPMAPHDPWPPSSGPLGPWGAMTERAERDGRGLSSSSDLPPPAEPPAPAPDAWRFASHPCTSACQ